MKQENNNAYIRKREKFPTNYFRSHIKNLEKQKHYEPEANRWKGIKLRNEQMNRNYF